VITALETLAEESKGAAARPHYPTIWPVHAARRTTENSSWDSRKT